MLTDLYFLSGFHIRPVQRRWIRNSNTADSCNNQVFNWTIFSWKGFPRPSQSVHPWLSLASSTYSAILYSNKRKSGRYFSYRALKYVLMLVLITTQTFQSIIGQIVLIQEKFRQLLLMQSSEYVLVLVPTTWTYQYIFD